jgi:radical SAM superfamily enzyme YgiQ (UPF0313 family)
MAARAASTAVKPPPRIISVALDYTRPKDPPISLGQASLLATLHQNEIPSIHRAWSVNHAGFKLNDVRQFVMDNARQHTDFALGAYVWHEPQTQALLNALKEDGFPGRIILGGPQVSYTKQGVERYYPQADVFIRGYGEKPLATLLSAKQETHIIPGVHYAGEPDLGLSATADLETLPSPFLSGLIKPQPFIRWETQRGCPFRCAFCQHRESDVSMERRQFSMSRIIDEARWITDNAIINDVAILDPTFNSGPNYLSVLDALIEGRYQGKLALQCRAEMVSDAFLERVQLLNQTANVVLEFGLQTIHREEARLIQRPNNLKKITRIIEETKRRGIDIEVSLIFGLPNQTLESFKASIKFCKDLKVPTIHAFPLMLLRGTPLYERKHELGLIESTDLDLNIDRVQDNIPHVVQSPSFSYAEWCEMAKLAEELDDYNADKKALKMSATLRHTMFSPTHSTAPNTVPNHVSPSFRPS